MVTGALGGRLIGHLVQWTVLRFPRNPIFGNCAAQVTGQSCITPGVYALIAAGSTMCGVTRLSVTLAVILFELTGSLHYVLPFSLAILVAKWTADFIEPLSIYVSCLTQVSQAKLTLSGPLNKLELVSVSQQQAQTDLYVKPCRYRSSSSTRETH